MQRLLFAQLLSVALSACSVGGQSLRDVPAFHTTATLRNCKTRIELHGTGHAVSGIRGEIERYPAAERFSDEWIDVEWVVKDRLLHASIANRSPAAITIDAAIVGLVKARPQATLTTIESGSSQHVPLAPIAVVQQYRDTPGIGRRSGLPSGTPVELRIRIAEKECSYQFHLAAGAV